MTDGMKETKTIDVAQADDWDLVVACNWYWVTPDLPRKMLNDLMHITWAAQDGYGERGYTPPQGWDWSGIRDSSPEAIKKMAFLCRQYLLAHDVAEFTVERVN